MGRIHSIQSMSAVDGPGVRTTVFLQGCPLRCVYCHNPDTWAFDGGEEVGTGALFDKIRRFVPYYGRNGGVTFSGGEPLAQADFVLETVELCRGAGLHTALDTSGCIWNDTVSALLDAVDLVLLDIKMTGDEGYRARVGCSIEAPLTFLRHAQERGKPVWIRHVVVPQLNDTEQDVRCLKEMLAGFSCIERMELLPFRTLCREKYAQMGLMFPLADTPDLSEERLQALAALLG